MVRLNIKVLLILSSLLFLGALWIFGGKDIRIRPKAARALSPSEAQKFLGIQDECPGCFGKEYCDQLFGTTISDAEMSDFSQTFRVFDGKKGDLIYWLKMTRLPSGFKDFVVRNGSGGETPRGDYSDSAPNSFLFSFNSDVSTLKKLNEIPTGRKIFNSILACPTWRVVDWLVQSHDFNQDKTISLEEKAVMLTSLINNPDLIIRRIASHGGDRVRLGSGFYEACGRATVLEPDLIPLSAYQGEDVEVKLNLSFLIMGFVESLLLDDEDWLYINLNISYENLVIDSVGQVKLWDLSRTVLLDKKEYRLLRDTEAYSFFKLQNFFGRKRLRCEEIGFYAQYVYAQACLAVKMLLGNHLRLRLKIASAIEICVEETLPGKRIQSFYNLMKLLKPSE